MNESKAVAILIDNSATSMDGDFQPNRLAAQLITAERYAHHLFSTTENSQVAIGTLSDTQFGIRVSFTTSIKKILNVSDNIQSTGIIDLERGLKSAVLALHHCNNVNNQNSQIAQNGLPHENNKDGQGPISKNILAFVGADNNITDKNIDELAKRLSDEDITLLLVIIGENVPNLETLKLLVDQVKPDLHSKLWIIPHSQTMLSDNVISLVVDQLNPVDMYRDDPALQDAIMMSKGENPIEIPKVEEKTKSPSVKTKLTTKRIKCISFSDQQAQQAQQRQQIPQAQVLVNQRQQPHKVKIIPQMQIAPPNHAPLQPMKLIQQHQLLHASTPQSRSVSPQQQQLSPPQQPQIPIQNGINVNPMQQQQLIFITQQQQQQQQQQKVKIKNQPQQQQVHINQYQMPLPLQPQIQPPMQPQMPFNQQQLQQMNPLIQYQQLQPQQPQRPMIITSQMSLQQINPLMQQQQYQQYQQQQYQQFQQQQIQQQLQQQQQQQQLQQQQQMQQQQAQQQQQKKKSRRGPNS